MIELWKFSDTFVHHFSTTKYPKMSFLAVQDSKLCTDLWGDLSSARQWNECQAQHYKQRQNEITLCSYMSKILIRNYSYFNGMRRNINILRQNYYQPYDRFQLLPSYNSALWSGTVHIWRNQPRGGVFEMITPDYWGRGVCYW